MNTYCPCGGLFVRSDTYSYFDDKYQREMVADRDPLAAHWKCNKCGAERTQKKRQPNWQKDDPAEIFEQFEVKFRQMVEAMKEATELFEKWRKVKRR